MDLFRVHRSEPGPEPREVLPLQYAALVTIIIMIAPEPLSYPSQSLPNPIATLPSAPRVSPGIQETQDYTDIKSKREQPRIQTNSVRQRRVQLQQSRTRVRADDDAAARCTCEEVPVVGAEG